MPGRPGLSRAPSASLRDGLRPPWTARTSPAAAGYRAAPKVWHPVAARRRASCARFEAGEKTSAIARDLRVSERSVERWRWAWREGGTDALRSAGPASVPKLSVVQFAELEAELSKGPAAHGFEDQRWTLAWVQAVIGRRFRMRLSIATVWRLLKRHGWSWQAPARRALERDEHAVELWKQEVWPRVKHRGGARGLARLRVAP
ncbi:winged helix-turn-helix domain-containing protein [Kitasatospora sp. NPDC085895]|uniref:winged helix-turn-helix domain-containing protein n=1 Tax=Kitasatospora sp. NPDC085895 TaxID=3155057 RepID=UPI00344D4CC4